MEETLRREIQAILAEGKDMALATVRPDGWPQATTVSYASDGLTIFFGCGATSQKAANLARDDRISATVTLPYSDWSQIRGLSLAGRARPIPSGDDAFARAGRLFLAKFPEVAQYVLPDGQELMMFRVEPVAFSVLDYSQGFGHTELIAGADMAA